MNQKSQAKKLYCFEHRIRFPFRNKQIINKMRVEVEDSCNIIELPM